MQRSGIQVFWVTHRCKAWPQSHYGKVPANSFPVSNSPALRAQTCVARYLTACDPRGWAVLALDEMTGLQPAPDFVLAPWTQRSTRKHCGQGYGFCGIYISSR